MIFEIELASFSIIDNLIKKTKKATRTQPIYDAASALMLNRIRTRFIDTESTDGEKWVESKAARQRARRGRGGGTLFDTGRLFHSIQPTQRKDELAIGTSVAYGARHQFGDGVIQREFLGFSDEDISDLIGIVEDQIKDL